MVGLGWTIPGRFESDQTILMRASCRYFAFLDLMSSSYFTFFVPTLDIDLVSWVCLAVSSQRSLTLPPVGMAHPPASCNEYVPVGSEFLREYHA